MKTSIKLFVTIFLLCTILACGARKSSLTKDLETKTSSAKIASNFQANNNIIFHDNSNRSITESDLEYTTVREFQLDQNGKPFLAKETLSNKKKDKSSEEFKENRTKWISDVKSEEKNQQTTQNNTVKKSKQVEADKTIVKNMGGVGVIILIVILASFTIYGTVKMKLK